MLLLDICDLFLRVVCQVLTECVFMITQPKTVSYVLSPTESASERKVLPPAPPAPTKPTLGLTERSHTQGLPLFLLANIHFIITVITYITYNAIHLHLLSSCITKNVTINY